MTSMPSPSAWRRSGRLLIFSFPRSFTSRSGKKDPNSIPSSVPSPRIPHRRPLASSFLFVDDHGCRLSHSPSFFLLSDLAADLFSRRRYRPSLFLPYSLPTELSPPATVAGSVLPLSPRCPRRLPLLHRPTTIPSPLTKIAVLIPHPRSSLPSTAGESQNLSLVLPHQSRHPRLPSFFLRHRGRCRPLLLPSPPSSASDVAALVSFTSSAHRRCRRSLSAAASLPSPSTTPTVSVSLPPPSRPPPLEAVMGIGRWEEEGASPSWLIEWTGEYWIFLKGGHGMACWVNGLG